MATLLLLMVTNSTNVVLIIFTLTVLDSNRLIPTAMEYMEDMEGVVMDMLEEIVTMDEATMAPVKIAPMISVMVTVNRKPTSAWKYINSVDENTVVDISGTTWKF